MEVKRKGEISKGRIIESAAKRFVVVGYQGTGINDILVDTNLPKGSFYYYFKSKKDLGIEVCSHYEKEMITWFSALADQANTWNEFIDLMIDDIHTRFENREFFGCPFTVFGSEVSIVEPEIAKQCTIALDHIQQIFAGVLRNAGKSRMKAEELAKRTLALYEGFLLYFRISWDLDTLESLRNSLKELAK